MAVIYVMLFINFMIINDIYVTIYSLAGYLIFYSLGMGPGSWLIASEVFCTSIRAKAMSIATCSNRLTASITLLTFLTLAQLLTWSGCFLLLALICLFMLVFFYFYLPETKGKTLEEMTMYFTEITGDDSILRIEEEMECHDKVDSANCPDVSSISQPLGSD